jgi:hypothetical protein
MAAYSKTILNDLGTKLVCDLSVGTSEQVHVTAASGILYMVEIDATGGAATTAEPGCYLKLINASAGVTGGGGSSSVPDMTLYAPIGKKTTYIISAGWTFDAGISFWCVKTAALSGNDSPTADIKVKLITT